MNEHEDKSRSAPPPPASLRQRAEAFLRTTSQHLQAMLPADVQRLVYELQVYQIELEIQNEELRWTQNELMASRDRYGDLYEFAPVGYLTINQKGVITQANLTASKLLRVERKRLLGRRLANFVVPEDRNTLDQYRRALFASTTTQTCELRFQLPDQQQINIGLESQAVLPEPGPHPEYRMALTDITQRKQAEEALEQSKERYRQLAEEREQQLIISIGWCPSPSLRSLSPTNSTTHSALPWASPRIC